MSTCCNPPGDLASNKSLCPVNGKAYAQVSRNTVLHHVASPWKVAVASQPYYFCDDPQCDVVYFCADGTTLTQADIRTPVGVKLRTPESLLCYCFGVTHAQAAADPSIRQFVIQETKSKSCACESRNPAGVCCLKNFPR